MNGQTKVLHRNNSSISWSYWDAWVEKKDSKAGWWFNSTTVFLNLVSQDKSEESRERNVYRVTLKDIGPQLGKILVLSLEVCSNFSSSGL